MALASKQELSPGEAARELYSKDKYWELPGFHEAMTDAEIVQLALLAQSLTVDAVKKGRKFIPPTHPKLNGEAPSP